MTDEFHIPDLGSALKTATYVRDVLSASGLKFIGNPDPHGIEKLSFRGTNFELTVDIFCGTSYITLKASIPILVPATATDYVLRKLNEQNIRHPLGGFELDTGTSKVSFKSALSIPPLPSGEVLKDVVLWTVAAADSFAPTLVELVKAPSAAA